jgi:hypothetical protein
MIDQRFFTADTTDYREFDEIDAFPEYTPCERSRLPPHGGFRDKRHAEPAFDHR